MRFKKNWPIEVHNEDAIQTVDRSAINFIKEFLNGAGAPREVFKKFETAISESR